MPGFPSINPLHKCSSCHCIFFHLRFHSTQVSHTARDKMLYTFAWEGTHTCRLNTRHHKTITVIYELYTYVLLSLRQLTTMLNIKRFWKQVNFSEIIAQHTTVLVQNCIISNKFSNTIAFCPTLTGLTVGLSHAPTLCSDKNNGLWSEVM